MTEAPWTDMLTEDQLCTRCGKKLEEPAWLELSWFTGLYYEAGKVSPPEHSQGHFPFGPDCAKKELRRTARES